MSAYDAKFLWLSIRTVRPEPASPFRSDHISLQVSHQVGQHLPNPGACTYLSRYGPARGFLPLVKFEELEYNAIYNDIEKLRDLMLTA
jgi:hypothetical protein